MRPALHLQTSGLEAGHEDRGPHRRGNSASRSSSHFARKAAVAAAVGSRELLLRWSCQWPVFARSRSGRPVWTSLQPQEAEAAPPPLPPLHGGWGGKNLPFLPLPLPFPSLPGKQRREVEACLQAWWKLHGRPACRRGPAVQTCRPVTPPPPGTEPKMAAYPGGRGTCRAQIVSKIGVFES